MLTRKMILAYCSLLISKQSTEQRILESVFITIFHHEYSKTYFVVIFLHEYVIQIQSASPYNSKMIHNVTLRHNSTMGHMKFKKSRAISRFPYLQWT
jgi:hypothetical protein